MALPIPVKTWQYSVNTAAYTATANLWYDIKDILCTLGTVPWTVHRSCNNIVADGNDNWNSPSDVVWNASSGQIDSWIVLEQPAIPGAAGNFQWLIVTYTDTVSGIRGGMQYFFSPSAGFTGGSTAARPTATDEVPLPATVTRWNRTIYSWSNTTGQPALRLHISVSDDGECTRIAMYRNAVIERLLIFDKPKNPIDGWTYPHIAINSHGHADAVGDGPTYALLNDSTADTKIGLPAGSGTGVVNCTGEGMAGFVVPEHQTWISDFDNAYPLMPVGLYCATTGARGRLGELYDCYWGSSGLANGTHYPNDTSRLWVQHRDLVFPWPGGAAILTS